MTTPAQLGERALRRLGVAIVPVASRPAPSGATILVRDIASRALQGLGVTVADIDSPPVTTTTPVADLAARALQALGVTVTDADRPPFATVIPDATLATGALVDLGVIAADETPSVADQALALARVRAIHDGLVAQGAVAWDLTGILQAASEDYIRLAAIALAPAFGKQGDASQQQITAAQVPALEARVKRTALIAQSQDLAERRVAAVHDELVANGHASWPLNGIPQAVSDDYVALIVQQMAPLFGAQAPAADATPVIEARVRHVALVLQAQHLAELRVAAIHDEMVVAGIVGWGLTGIPQGVAEDYVALTSIHLAPTFDQKPDLAAIPALEARVRAYSVVARAPGLATEAILQVHADLVARGKTRWTSADIPRAAERPYVMLAAHHLAPEFGKQVSADDVVLAEKALARMIALPTSGERVRADYF